MSPTQAHLALVADADALDDCVVGLDSTEHVKQFAEVAKHRLAQGRELRPVGAKQ
jgi:hypothetical protein